MLNKPIVEPQRKIPSETLRGLSVETTSSGESLMGLLGYGSLRLFPSKLHRRSSTSNFSFRAHLLNEKRKAFERKRKFFEPEYGALLEDLRANRRVMTLAQYTRGGHPNGDDVLLIRHDIDHDIENAVKIARWEFRYGIQSTFCVLHSAWYYGELSGERYVHSTLLEESLQEIQSLGHEINFHNNLVTLGLQKKVNVREVLLNELDWLRSIGIHVQGTSTHGDKLCRELGYRNFELFEEAIGTRFGGPRTVSHVESGNDVALGQLSFRDFDLTYEAYDIHRERYITDSGGKLREHANAMGRRSFGLEEGGGNVTAILTHPIWWGGF